MSDEHGDKRGDEPDARETAQPDARLAVADEPVAGTAEAERDGDSDLPAAEAAPPAETTATGLPGDSEGEDQPAAGPSAESPAEEVAESVTLDAVMQARAHVEESVPADQEDAAEPARAADPQLKAAIEALIFASPEPLTPKMLFKLLEGEPKEDVELALNSLRDDYLKHGGVQIVEVAGGYQIVTRPEMHEWVRRLFHERRTQKLSVQALETLAVIAYKQPITAPEIAEIRGVNTAGVLSTLLERHLVKIAGRKAVVGRPFLYATTREFLIRFGLRDLGDLPKVEDLADVLGFEPPAGLADSGPSEGRLPLEVESAPADDDPAEEPGPGERVH